MEPAKEILAQISFLILCIIHWASFSWCPLKSKQHKVVAEYTVETSRTMHTSGHIGVCIPPHGLVQFPLKSRRVLKFAELFHYCLVPSSSLTLAKEATLSSSSACSRGLSDPIQTAKWAKPIHVSGAELASG